MTTLSHRPAAAGDDLGTALHAIYSWNYGSEVDELRALYAKSLDLQWNAMRDLPWDTEIDRELFAGSFTLGGFPIQKTHFWGRLSSEVRWEVARRGTAIMLSNFLHGEQGALMVASQLVNAVPHMDGKFYAASQTLDEARHVEVFSAYIQKLDRVYPIAPSLKRLLDATLGGDNWLLKCVGMQIVVEGLALFTFRDMRNTTREPLLHRLLTYVGRDEARHTAYGIKYLGAVLPSLSDAERRELEDFAFEAARLLLDSRTGTTIRESVMLCFAEAGIDPAEVFAEIAKEREHLQALFKAQGGRRGPVTGFVIPTLRRIGLYSQKLDDDFRGMFSGSGEHGAGLASGLGGRSGEVSIMDQIVELPEDLEAWVNEGAALGG